MSLTNAEAARLLDLSVFTGDRLRLVTELGDAETPGDAVDGVNAELSWDPATGPIKATSMPMSLSPLGAGGDTVVVGWEVWSDDLLQRRWWGLLSPSEGVTTAGGVSVSATPPPLGAIIVFPDGREPVETLPGSQYHVVVADGDLVQIAETADGLPLMLAEGQAVTLGRVVRIPLGDTLELAAGDVYVQIAP